MEIDKINLGPLSNFTKEYVTSKLRFKPGTKIAYSQLIKGINNLNATQNFSAIDYSLDESVNGKDNLNISLIENPTQTYLKFGLHYDGLFKSAVLVNLTRKKTLFKNDIASLDVVLGDNFRYNFDYYVENGYNLSLGFKSQFNQFNRNVAKELSGLNFVDTNVNSINMDYSDFTNQLYFQSLFVQKFLLGAGIEFKDLRINSPTLENSNQFIEKSQYGSVFGYLKYDSLDNKYFPTKGWFFSGDVQSYLLSSNYTNNFNPFSIAKADFGLAAKVFKHATIRVETEGGFSFGSDSVPYLNFVLGGYGFNTINNFRHFYGYDFLSLAGNSYIKSTLNFDYEILKKNHLNFTANFANIGTNIFNSVDWISIPKYSGYALGYGLETVVGPIEIKHSWSPENSKGYTWFSVGFVF